MRLFSLFLFFMLPMQAQSQPGFTFGANCYTDLSVERLTRISDQLANFVDDLDAISGTFSTINGVYYSTPQGRDVQLITSTFFEFTESISILNRDMSFLISLVSPRGRGCFVRTVMSREVFNRANGKINFINQMRNRVRGNDISDAIGQLNGIWTSHRRLFEETYLFWPRLFEN